MRVAPPPSTPTPYITSRREHTPSLHVHSPYCSPSPPLNFPTAHLSIFSHLPPANTPEGPVFIRPSSNRYAPGIPELILSAIGNSYSIADVRI
jgi:hypothetical protein